MDIEKITVSLRQRSSWEALDLGLAIARQWWPTLLASLILVAGPIVLFVNFLCAQRPWLALLILWWLKPLFERLPLLIISRRFFGEHLGPLEALRLVQRPFLAGLFGQLTWRRLSPLRSYLAPVEALEGLWGPARGARANLIARAQTFAASTCTVVFFFAELAIFISVFAFLAMVWPGETELGKWPAELLRGEAGWHLIVTNVVYVAAMILVMPFYAAAGFSLYINRRVDLEGWDIDLAFRRLARRLEKERAVAVGLVLLILSITAPAQAEPAPGVADVRAAAERVTNHADFGGERLDLVWRPIRSDPEEDTEVIDSIAELSIPEVPRFGFGSVFVWLIGIAGVITLLFLIRAIWRGRAERERANEIEPHPPETLFGLDIRPLSLPKDITTAARAAWSNGDPELALSLLYRAALAHLTAHTTIQIPKSATEGECIGLVSGLVSEQVARGMADDFAALTRAWVHAAYGHLPPDDQTFSRLVDHWGLHLGAAK